MNYLRRKTKEFKKSLLKFRFLAFLLGGIGLLLDIIFSQSVDVIPQMVIVLFWLILAWLYRLSEKIFFAMAVIFLILTPIHLIFGREILAEKLAVWGFLFIGLGLFWWIMEETTNFLKDLKKRK